MPIVKVLADLKIICQSAIDDASALHPECVFKFTTKGELLDDFDSGRLQQVFSNLLNNAAQYHDKESAITISAQGESDAIIVKVSNSGSVIPAKSLQAIFDPLTQLSLSDQQEDRPSTSLGLGLFIAREITLAHEGTIDVASSKEQGTVFSVRIPRTK
ncbi:signal transduction histidine kinase [Actimicrobium sp. GrIS 1.19]|uniref:sensor histidine kinase n=1 Tax=Actimicrobium sp. GrIS 1.19 TaxID=3071708 RepID=UPI002E00D5F9|nr:signal transduction histidine kinase [Actimicrobium sp. GrIS 1.19]